MPGHDPSSDFVLRRRVTSAQLAGDLRGLGITEGQTVLVHGSLRSLGRVAGGAPAVVAALRAAVGPTGNVVVPAGTEGNSLTSRVFREHAARLTADEAEAYPRTMPAFDQDSTPSTMGAISEALRTSSGAVRSAHPQSSFAAVGPDARDLMADHPLECHLGLLSPLWKLYKRGADVLFLGVGYAACTAFHLAEYLYKEEPPVRAYWCVIRVNGWEQWVEFEDVVLDDGDFAAIGAFLEKRIPEKWGHVGSAASRLVPMRQLVDRAIEWMRENRA